MELEGWAGLQNWMVLGPASCSGRPGNKMSLLHLDP